MLPNFIRKGIFSVSLMLSLLAVASFAIPVSYSPIIGEAHAQVKKPRKRVNVFNLLFGKRGSLNNSRFKRNSAKRIKLRNNRVVRTKRQAPVAKITTKNEDALKILVAGDFMAGGLAWGMQQAFAENQGVTILDISKGLSGFVRDDVKNWPEDITAHIKEAEPAAVVFLAGMNDRQQMRLGNKKVRKLSEPWKLAYNSRVQTLANNLKASGVPVIWVGLLPVKSGKMNNDYLQLNEIYRSHVESVGGTFVSVWDGFTNEEGQFVSAGPDINGQIKRLRSSDGINLNRTGKRKLAFYVNKAVRKLTGIGTESLLVSLPGLETPGVQLPQYDPAKTGKTIVYSLASPNLDGAVRLVDDQSAIKPEERKKLEIHRLVEQGEVPRTHPGRIDHYGIVGNEVKQDNLKASDKKEDEKTSRSSDKNQSPEKPKT